MRKNKSLSIILSFALLFSLCFAVLGAKAATTATPKALTSDGVFKIFYNALGNRGSMLNANSKTGYQGSFEYITSKISTTTFSTLTGKGEPYNSSTGARERLDYFKTQFSNDSSNVLETRDKAGIKQAMVARYNDICYAGVKAKVGLFSKWFPTIFKGPADARKTALKKCQDTFNAAVRTQDGDIKPWKIEGFKIDRDICVGTAHLAYANSIKSLYDTSATSTVITTDVAACSNDARVKDWPTGW